MLLFDVVTFFVVWLVKTPTKYMLKSPAKYFLQSIQNISCDQEGVAVYPPVPGLQPSPYYKFRLQKVPLSIIVTVNRHCKTSG